MANMECWLCGEPPVVPSACTVTLPRSSESVTVFARRIGVKMNHEDDGEVVCQPCFDLISKIDQISFDLDTCVLDLKKRCGKGELSHAKYPTASH